VSLEDRLYPFLSLYEKSPAWVKVGAGTLYRMLPERVRFGSAIQQFRELAAAFDEMPPEAIRSWQESQLRLMLEHACETCPFYREHYRLHQVRPSDFRRVEDLAAFPAIEKRHVQEFREEMTSRSFGPERRLYITTGGSTGVPVGFYLERGVSRPKEQAFLERMWQRAGYRRGDRLVVIRGHVTTRHSGGGIASYDATRDWLMLSSYHLSQRRFAEYRRAIESFRPRILHAYPSAALILAELVEQSGRPLAVKLDALLCGSENLTVPQKRILERVFGCRVYRWYGHSERAVLAGEGERSELFYFFPQYGFVEFALPDAEGLREVVGTSFHNMVMPLIRYRTDDLVQPVGDETEREFPWAAVLGIRGRQHEFLVSGQGRRISLTAFNMHDGIFDGLYAVQFRQDQPGKAEMRYIPSPGFDTRRLSDITARVLRKLGDDFDLGLVQVEETEKTAQGKHRWLVSTLAESRSATTET
jgi:phenylacetate-CoA ligase